MEAKEIEYKFKFMRELLEKFHEEIVGFTPSPESLRIYLRSYDPKLVKQIEKHMKKYRGNFEIVTVTEKDKPIIYHL
jgi:hypothetical protein